MNQLVGDAIWVTPKVNGQTLKMELDTGSAVSTLPVQKNEEMLKTYSGEEIAPEGKVHVRVQYKNKVKDGYTRSNLTGNSSVLLLKRSRRYTLRLRRPPGRLELLLYAVENVYMPYTMKATRGATA